MAKKKTVCKWIGAIAFTLLAIISVVQNIKLLMGSIAMLPEPFLLVNLISLAIKGGFIVGYLLLGVACLLRKGRILAMIGAAVLILMSLLGLVKGWCVYGINIMSIGLKAYLNPSVITSIIGSQVNQLIKLLIPIVLLLLLILHKKENKILCFAPAALHVVSKVWYLFYTVLVKVLFFDSSFSGIMNTVLDSNWLSLLLNVIAFAAIGYVMAGKKELPAENT